MKRFGMTKLRAFGIAAVIALIVVASNTGPTETGRNNGGESLNHMAEAPTGDRSSTSGQSSTSDAARDTSADSGPAAASPGDSAPAAASPGDSAPAAASPGDSGPAARSSGHSAPAASPGEPRPAVRSDSPDRAASPAPTASPTTAKKVGPVADGGGTTTTTPTTAAKQWVQVVKMSGRADQRTAPFRLRGGEVRLRYDYGGDGLFLVSVAESKPAGERDEHFYYVDRHCSEPCQGTQPLDKQAGAYYVDVQSTRGPWSVVLEEYR